MIDVVYYLFNSLGIISKPDRLMLPKWVKVSEERFSEILSTVTKAKKEGLKINVDGRAITLENAESLLKDLGNGILDRHEFKNRYKNNANDTEAIINKSPLTRSQNKMLETLLLLKELVVKTLYKNSSQKKQESSEQPDTTDMPELESEESTAERRNQLGQGLKMLTPDQMLSRLPITLAQLKAGNNSQKLINEIRQLLYSLYRSKKLTKTIYNHLINAI